MPLRPAYFLYPYHMDTVAGPEHHCVRRFCFSIDCLLNKVCC